MKFYNFIPPSDFSFPTEYYLSIPKNCNATDFTRFIHKVTELLSNIYSIPLNDLFLLFSKDNTIFSLKIKDDNTKEGIISFTRFEGIIEHVKKIFLSTASFVIYKEPITEKIPDEAQKYLNLCNFLQTEKGSFVAKIQLPSKEVLRPKGLFDEKELISEDINEKLIEVLSFVSDKILSQGKLAVEDKFLTENKSLINIQLLKNIEELYTKNSLYNINYSFINSRYYREVKFSKINYDNIDNLTNFISIVEKSLNKNISIDTKGHVIELKSNDPTSNNNTIRISAIVDNLSSIIVIPLNKDDYSKAIQAHGNKQFVSVKGIAEKSKTQFKIIKLNSFKII